MLKSKILSQETSGENFIAVKRFLTRCPPWFRQLGKDTKSNMRIFGFLSTNG